MKPLWDCLWIYTSAHTNVVSTYMHTHSTYSIYSTYSTLHACMHACKFAHSSTVMVFSQKKGAVYWLLLWLLLWELLWVEPLLCFHKHDLFFCKPFGSKAVNTATSGTPVYPMVLSRGSQPNTFFLFHAPWNLSIFFSFDMGNRTNHGTTWWAPYPPHPSKKNMSSALGPTGSVSSWPFFFLHPSEWSWPFTFGCALQLKSTKWAKLSCLPGSTWLRFFSFWNNGGTSENKNDNGGWREPIMMGLPYVAMAPLVMARYWVCKKRAGPVGWWRFIDLVGRLSMFVVDFSILFIRNLLWYVIVPTRLNLSKTLSAQIPAEKWGFSEIAWEKMRSDLEISCVRSVLIFFHIFF